MHLYFHADFDGLACAALLEDFFGRGDQTVEGRHALPTQRRRGWHRERLQRPAAVADFRHHPDADWWFDHHRSSCAGAPSGERFYCDPSSPSCARLVANVLARDWQHPAPRFAALTEAADRIDASAFEDPSELVDCATPWLRLSLAVQTAADLSLVEGAAARLAAEPQDATRVIEGDAALGRALEMALQRQQTQLARLRSDGETTWGGGLFVHPPIDYAFHKYLPFVAMPAASLSVGLLVDRGHFEVAVCKNRWRPDRRLASLDVGALCRDRGGGGHLDRGAVPTEDRRAAEEVRDDLLCSLSRSLPSPE